MKERLNPEIKKRIYAAIAVALTLVIICGAAVTAYLRSRPVAHAVFDPDSAVTYQVFKGKRSIDDSVLFIGTYILHKDALTDQLYEKAQNSASQSGQDEVYYKSELADGQWFNVGDIDNGLKGISTAGKPVAEQVLDPLYVQYYAGADGVLIDAMTNLPVNPFDVPDPYDLKSMEELQPLWMQYTNSQSTQDVSLDDFLKNRASSESGKLRTDVYLYQLLHTFFSIDLRDENANLYARQLSQLNASYISLKAQGAEDEAALVYELMEKVDATRRAEVFEKLATLDVSALDTLFTLAGGAYYTSSGTFKDSSSESNRASEPDYIVQIQDAVKYSGTSSVSSWLSSWLSRLGVSSGNVPQWWSTLERAEQERRDKDDENYEKLHDEDEDYGKNPQIYEYPFEADSTILDAIGTCMSNCQESYTNYISKALRDEESVLGHADYVYSSQVIENTSAAGLGGPVTQLKHVRNIKEAVVVDAAGELSLLQSSLITEAGNSYARALMRGVPDGYSDLDGEDAKKSAIDEEKADTEKKRSELELLIDGVRMRDKAANALEFTYQRIDWSEGQYGSIRNDDYKGTATTSLDAHIVWLKDLAKRIIDSDDSLKSDLDKLRDKKEELQEKRDDALDNNDLSGAAAYDARIDAVDQDIADEEDRLADKMNDGTAGDQAAAQNAAGNSADALAKQLVDKAVEKLSDNANADMTAVANSLAGLGAVDALNDLADKAEASGSSASAVKALRDAAADAAAEAGGDTAAAVNALKDAANSLAAAKSGNGAGYGSGGAGDGSGGAGDGAGGIGDDAGSTGDGSDGAGDADSALDDAIKALNDAAGKLAGSGTSDSRGAGSGVSADDLLAALAGLFGDMDGMSDKEIAVATAALSQFSKMGCEAATSLAVQFNTRGVSSGNRYFYTQYDSDKTTEFVSLKTIGSATGFRYFYDDAKRTAVMTKGGRVYGYTRGGSTVMVGGQDGEVQTMTREMVFSGVPYIAEADAEAYFGCDAEYIVDTSSAVCYTDTMASMISEVLEVFGNL